MIHQAELVVRVGIPRPLDLERAGGLAPIGVAQVRRDAAILTLELLDRVERRTAGEEGNRRVQPAARDEQQREAGAGLLEVDANGTFFVGRHGASSLTGLSKHPRYRRHRGRGGARRQYAASDRVHGCRLP